MGKRGIESYFQKRRIGTDVGGSSNVELSTRKEDEIENNLQSKEVPRHELPPFKISKIGKESNASHVAVERDPGKRQMIWEYSVNKRDEIRREYLMHGPYQVEVPNSERHVDKYGRRFLLSWYDQFRDWLEYSPSKNAAFCFPCFLFGTPGAKYGGNAFVVDGFRAWKRVNNGKKCGFLIHVGCGPNSAHKVAVKCCLDLMNSLQHLDRVVDKQTSESIIKNRLRVKVSIDAVKLCALQGIAFRGHDERLDSHNRGNFLEILKHTASYNEDVASVILENAPKNASYTSHPIQKEILSLYAKKIQKFIRDEIGDAKFCIIVDESRDESKREQMAIILRFVDKDGFVRERFFDIVHVEDTKAATLKNKITEVLSHHNLSIQNIRGQGYDGASNMRGEWNGLQALFSNECPYAYYIHCFAHRLQLILVATSQSVIPVEHFFSQLVLIINVVDSSSKRHDQLQIAQAIRIEELTSTNQLETGRGKNQIGSLQRPGDTRWSSHLKSMHSLLKMFDSVLVVLSEIINDKSVASRAVADKSYDVMMSFEFVFILHFLIEVLGRANDLCRMLQCLTQDIVNAIDAVSNTKEIIQNFRENGWNELLVKVKVFCEQRDIEVPDMNGVRRSSRGRSPNNPITWEHHYRVDIFCGTIDSILQELGSRFNEDAVELLKLSSSLDPRRDYELFDIDNICKLVEKYYPADFSSQEKLHLKYQLELYEIDIRKNAHFQNVATLSELCQVLSKTGKSVVFSLVDRLIRLILTLPVSTATSERAFSAMKIVKSRLRNKMEDDFLSSSLIMFIEREIAQSFDVDSIINEFDLMKTRRSHLRISK